MTRADAEVLILIILFTVWLLYLRDYIYFRKWRK